MIAVLLAEFGGRAALFLKLPRLVLAATLLGLSVGAAAFAGISLAPVMNAHARALMLGIALIWSGSPVGAAAGALAGIAGAVALGAAPLALRSVVRLRYAAGVTTTLTGLYAVLWALRFIA